MEWRLEQLAGQLGGVVHGDGSVVIVGLAGVEDANPGDITFADHERALPLLKSTKASAAIVPRHIPDLLIPQVVVGDPRLAMAKALALLTSGPYHAAGISEKSWISPSAVVADDVSIYPFAYVGENARIGSRVTIHPGVCIGREVTIGDDTVLYPNVVIYPQCVIGARVILHAGVIIGSDGFGFVKEGGRNIKIPQVGTVEVEDDVEIGANSCVDRATFGATRIKHGVKIDNLVQVAHNVLIGEDSVVVAQVGISGSTTLGKNVTLGGQVGLADHLDVGDNVMVAAQSGVMKDVPSDHIVAGTPALPHRHALRVASVWAKLPELKREVDELKARLEELERRRDQDATGQGGSDD